MKYYKESLLVPASVEDVFAFVNDHTRLASHMNKSSWMMGGGSMETKLDGGKGQEVGSHIQMSGTVLGVRIFLDEVISVYEPPHKKEWHTVGNLRLLIIGHYTMGIKVAQEQNGSRLTVYISYELPTMFPTKVLGILFGKFYAQWCVRQMLQGSKEFWKPQPLK